MAETLLIDLFKEASSIAVQLAEQEINLLVGVDEEVQELQGKFRMIKAMLDDAERHAVKQRTEKLWLEQLQNLYYEMDDVLDTWNTARIRAEIEKEGKPADNNAPAVVKKKVCSFVPSPSCCFNLPLRHDVGHMIRKLNEKLDKIFKNKVTYGIDLDRQPDVVERPPTTTFVDVSHIVGRDRHRDELLRNLLGVGCQEERNSYCVISLVGIGGIGKTTLAQLAYKHPDVQAHFQERMWICVSNPFDQCKVAKAIIKEIDPKHRSLNNTELQTLLRVIHDLIKDKKFFLVLDDVWTEHSNEWEPFKHALENGVHGSRILVTTRNQIVVKMIGSALTINLEVLSEEDCWLIFSKTAFSNEKQLKYLEDIGKKLASKCKGLPLAAKTLGSLMQNKSGREQWNTILGSDMWELEDIERGLLAPLLLSYYELPSSMRSCFSFCAVFPKDYLFSRDQLVLHWMAQGYIESKANMELEDIAEEYFEMLAMRSFFQDFEKDKDNDEKIISCKMHDIVHDFARFLTKNESLEIGGDKKLEMDCQRPRHLYLKFSEEMQCLESIYRAKNLRTVFLIFDKIDYQSKIPLSNLFRHFKCLRTLIINYSVRKLPDAVENLIHLRWFEYLGVVLQALPETFCNLCNLQTLRIVNGCTFFGLPRGMSKLINLRHLICETPMFCSMVEFPKGMGKLTGLRTLSIFNIGVEDDREGCKLGELKVLNQLRGTLIINGLNNVVNVDEAQNAQLKDKIHLQELELCFRSLGLGQCFGSSGRNVEKSIMENDGKVLNALEPPPNLQCLQINSYKGNTINSSWMMSWTTLKRLQIWNCDYLERLPSLGQLPFLEVLKMKYLSNVKKVGDEFLIEDSNKKESFDIIFPNLKSLEFFKLSKWKEWTRMGGTGEKDEIDNGIVTNLKIMPCLESLRIGDCNKLKSLPDYLLTAPCLKELEISNSRTLQERYRRGTGENWHEISHISKTKSGSEISDEDDVGAGSAECVVDERVEVDNDEGSEICEADR